MHGDKRSVSCRFASGGSGAAGKGRLKARLFFRSLGRAASANHQAPRCNGQADHGHRVRNGLGQVACPDSRCLHVVGDALRSAVEEAGGKGTYWGSPAQRFGGEGDPPLARRHIAIEPAKRADRKETTAQSGEDAADHHGDKLGSTDADSNRCRGFGVFADRANMQAERRFVEDDMGERHQKDRNVTEYVLIGKDDADAW